MAAGLEALKADNFFQLIKLHCILCLNLKCQTPTHPFVYGTCCHLKLNGDTDICFPIK